jgi:glycolate oxidase
VVEIGGAHLDAAGYDLLGLICGSEGQLGVVTEATLRILRKPEGARPVLMGFDSNEVAGPACPTSSRRASCRWPSSSWTAPASRRLRGLRQGGLPDVRGAADRRGRRLGRRDRRAAGRDHADRARHNPVELREAQSEDEAKRIWLGRKSAFGAMGQINDYMCLDGTIPVSALPYVLRRIGEMSKEYGLDVANVFHAGDGNMHPLILFDANKPGDLELCEAFGAEILKLCVEVGGCLTGEHGVGIEKRDLMTTQFAPADLEAQMKVKDVFDPAWLLNPAKVFPLA